MSYSVTLIMAQHLPADSSLLCEPCPSAIKSLSVFSLRGAKKGEIAAVSVPLFVHQTLANRKQILTCANCHRFIGTPVTQLAMLEGALSNRGQSSGSRGNDESEGRTRGLTKGKFRSLRTDIATADPHNLPGLPDLKMGAKKPGKGNYLGSNLKDKTDSTNGPCRCVEVGRCDDIYCCDGCRRQAIAAGHNLICMAHEAEGSPLFEFHKYALSTSETYLIAASAVAAAISLPEKTRPFEALGGWDEPFGRNKEEEEEEKGQQMPSPLSKPLHSNLPSVKAEVAATTRLSGGARDEEMEETWGLLHVSLVMGSSRVDETEHSVALSLDFYRRLVRALDRHLAPLTVPSPLVSYCLGLEHTTSAVREEAFPWLSDIIAKVGCSYPSTGRDASTIHTGTAEEKQCTNSVQSGGSSNIAGGGEKRLKGVGTLPVVGGGSRGVTEQGQQ
ncbi:unnamed protein product, partial [Choristocarpus tenellus]